MGWPIVRRGPSGSTFHVETEWNAELEVPIRVVCDVCTAARALSTPQAVLVGHDEASASNPAYNPEDSESVWISQAEAFQQHHRCRTAPEGREESI